MWWPTEKVAKAVWSAAFRTPEVFVKAWVRQDQAAREESSRPHLCAVISVSPKRCTLLGWQARLGAPPPRWGHSSLREGEVMGVSGRDRDEAVSTVSSDRSSACPATSAVAASPHRVTSSLVLVPDLV